MMADDERRVPLRKEESIRESDRKQLGKEAWRRKESRPEEQKPPSTGRPEMRQKEDD
jgi:hypothetical protein